MLSSPPAEHACFRQVTGEQGVACYDGICEMYIVRSGCYNDKQKNEGVGRMSLQAIFIRIRSLGQIHKLVSGLKKEFWIGHLLVMASTVLGVYLAAHSGLKSAIEFDAITSDRDNYYLRANLRDEVLYNIGITKQIIKTIDKVGSFDRKNYPNFQTYVMDTMREQSNTLKTPNKILSGTLQYYDQVNRLYEQRSKHLLSYPVLADRLRHEVDKYSSKVLPILEQDLENLKRRIEKSGLTVY